MTAARALTAGAAILAAAALAGHWAWRSGRMPCLPMLEQGGSWQRAGSGGSSWARDPSAHIAHAGGGIDGVPYTNSEEAVLASIAEGYRLIELDLAVSADGAVVAVHDWAHFKRLAGFPDAKIDGSPLSLAEFKAQRLAGRFTPLDGRRIGELLAAHPQVTLVTDKIRDLRRLRAAIPFEERMIVEVFDRDDFEFARALGFKRPMFSVGNLGRDLEYAAREEVRLVAVSAANLSLRPEAFRRLRRAGKVVFTFSSDDPAFLQEHLGCSASAAYNDGWSLRLGACAAGPCRTY